MFWTGGCLTCPISIYIVGEILICSSGTSVNVPDLDLCRIADERTKYRVRYDKGRGPKRAV